MATKNFPGKSTNATFLFLYFRRCAKYQKNIMNRFRENWTGQRRTKERMDKHESMGRPLTEVQKAIRMLFKKMKHK